MKTEEEYPYIYNLYNIPEEIDDNLDNITYIKERANQEKRTDLFTGR